MRHRFVVQDLTGLHVFGIGMQQCLRVQVRMGVLMMMGLLLLILMTREGNTSRRSVVVVVIMMMVADAGGIVCHGSTDRVSAVDKLAIRCAT